MNFIFFFFFSPLLRVRKGSGVQILWNKWKTTEKSEQLSAVHGLQRLLFFCSFFFIFFHFFCTRRKLYKVIY